MKKIIMLFVCLLSIGLAFAEGITVKSVKGKVTYVTASGKKEPIKVGQSLSASTVINTGVGAVLVVEKDGTEYTIKSMKKGTVDILTDNLKGLNSNPGTAPAIAASVDNTGKGEATLSQRGNVKSASIGDIIDE